jgi:amidase
VGQEISQKLDAFVARLRTAGAMVVEAEPAGFSYQRTWEIWGALVGMQGGYERSNLARWVGNLIAGSEVAHIPHQRRILEPISLPGYMQALEGQDEQIDALDAFLSEYDVWIVPVSPTPAIEHTRPSSSHGIFNVYDASISVNGKPLPYYTATQAYATLFSVTESPVVSMPIGRTDAGLPVGVQVVGRRFEDLRLLRSAALLSSLVDPMPYPLDTRTAR